MRCISATCLLSALLSVIWVIGAGHPAAAQDAGESTRAIAQLGDASVLKRMAAARQLGVWREQEAAPALRMALADEFPAVRAAAAWALGRLRDRESIDLLAQALADEDDMVQANAAFALSVFGDRRAARVLVGLLEQVVVPGDEQVLVALAAESGRVMRGEDTMSLLQRTVAAVVRMGDAATPWCEPLVVDPRPEVRLAAVVGLAGIRTPGAMALLIRATQDGNEYVRLVVAHGLAYGEGVDVMPALRVLVEDASSDVRGRALLGFCAHPDRKAIPLLRDRLQDVAGENRRLAVIALAATQDPLAFEMIRSAVDDPDPTVRNVAEKALQEMNAGGRHDH